ncbi:hypothetical protein [Devosia sp. XK-2]|uniref:hypothetical protein n=1 Tax=Devosia sp. XK-2 TaxID=3126689 RepID=UPI0030CABE6D
MLTTGRSTEANGDKRRWMFRRPGQKSAPLVDGMSNPQGGRSMHASEILFVGSGFRLFFNLTEAKAAFHRATAGAGRRAIFRHAHSIAERSLNFEMSRRARRAGGATGGEKAMRAWSVRWANLSGGEI